jgi:hypothetical protein
VSPILRDDSTERTKRKSARFDISRITFVRGREQTRAERAADFYRALQWDSGFASR